MNWIDCVPSYFIFLSCCQKPRQWERSYSFAIVSLCSNVVFFYLFWFLALKAIKIWRHIEVTKIFRHLNLLIIRSLTINSSKSKSSQHPWHHPTASLCAVAPRFGSPAQMVIAMKIIGMIGVWITWNWRVSSW